MKIKLNCDMGESFGIYKLCDDSTIMPFIDMANIACGFHASDSLNMSRVIKDLSRFDIEIGAHPSYQDIIGFGRRSIKCTNEEIQALIIYQIGALKSFCKLNNTKLKYVKPHGALYNDMMGNIGIFSAICEIISEYDNKLKLMILSSPKNHLYDEIATSYNIKLIYEAFVDRNYSDDGYLISRDENFALLKSKEEILLRAQKLKHESAIYSINGKKLSIQVDTLCVHGDNSEAISIIKEINQILDEV